VKVALAWFVAVASKPPVLYNWILLTLLLFAIT
jgi:hypothetical protein